MGKTRLLLIFDLILVLIVALNSPMLYGKILQSRYDKPTPPIQTIVPNPQTQPLPSEVNIDMTFYAQAPYNDWREPWQNACEEASLLLIANKYNNYNWTRAQFKAQILTLVDWENRTFGDYKDNDVQQITRALKELYNLQSVLHHNPTFENVQNILAQGHLIIIPIAGKELANPHFKNGGPTYHMIVIKGYKPDQQIITADVGTMYGENYIYSWETLKNANHDYTIPIDNGAKIIIEVLPNNS